MDGRRTQRMHPLTDGTILGRYQVIRQAWTPAPAEAWVVLRPDTQTNHLAYRVGPFDQPDDRRRVSEWVDSMLKLRPSHVLPVDAFSFGVQRDAWLVTPYTGNQLELVRLPAVVESRGGQLPPFEVERAVAQLLDALDAGHGGGLAHGPLDSAEVLVDRHGRLTVELFGLRRRLDGLRASDAELRRDEVRSVVELGYRLLTGIDAASPPIPVSRLIRRLPRGWDAWFGVGLDPTRGFDSAAAALDALPSVDADTVEAPESGVLAMLGRLRSSLREKSGETTSAG